ncbi:hypothetical protein ADIS_1442 [Lunatimonas lonarensis]|uniref:Uncharacterized protein n=1 Tax=Lunatimonas lonarensis TaxID=1232681 RepID=R7ZVR9_9BACT|nr:hypothetical protein ADIS_1442 [Lunatimonas lonarensis]
MGTISACLYTRPLNLDLAQVMQGEYNQQTGFSVHPAPSYNVYDH